MAGLRPFFALGSRNAIALAITALVAGCDARTTAPPPSTVGPLRIALHETIRGFDPHRAGDQVSFILFENVFETLVDFGEGTRIVPEVAAGWSNPDDLTWRFEIRDDVRFHDGRPLEPEDVVASLERARRPSSAVATHLADVAAIRTTGERTVELVTERPSPLLLNRLTQIFLLPADAPDRIDERGAVGSGRYRVERSEGQTLHLIASSDHRLGAPEFPRVVLRPVPDQGERIALLLSGEIDLAGRIVAADSSPLEKAPGVRRLIVPSLQTSIFLLRKDREPFTDPRVREAVELGLDRGSRARQSFGDDHGQLVGPEVFGFDPGRSPPLRNPTRARELLAAAGHPEGIDVDLALGRGIDLEDQVVSLRDAGIRVRPGHRPFPELVDALDSGTVPFAYLSVVASTGDVLEILESLAHSPSEDGLYGRHNWTGLVDPDLDRLIEEAGSTLDLELRRKLLQRALALLASHRVVLPLITPSDVWGIRRGLEWRPRLDGRVAAAEIRPRQTTREKAKL